MPEFFDLSTIVHEKMAKMLKNAVSSNVEKPGLESLFYEPWHDFFREWIMHQHKNRTSLAEAMRETAHLIWVYRTHFLW